MRKLYVIVYFDSWEDNGFHLLEAFRSLKDAEDRVEDCNEYAAKYEPGCHYEIQEVEYMTSDKIKELYKE